MPNSNPNIVHKWLVGNAAAQNIELGFIPEKVEVINVTDGDLISIWYRGQVIPFTSGGTAEVSAGDTITGATSGATAFVSEVLLHTGSWAGGDAAGFFMCDDEDITGTFGSENVNTPNQDNIAGVSVQSEDTVAISTAVASATGDAAITAYQGSSGSNAKGVTLGSTICEEAKLLHLIAYR